MTSPSGVYIPSYASLGNHPKLLKFARRMEIDKVQAIGHLHCLWWWSMTYAPDGDLSDFDTYDIALAAEYQGDPDLLWNELERAGFIDDDGTLHDWTDYGGKVLTQREKNAEKQARYRTKQGRNRNVTVTLPESDGLEKSREEKKRVEKKTTPLPPKGDENGGYTQEFQDFWDISNRKGAKADAQKAWNKLSSKQRTEAKLNIQRWVAVYPQVGFAYDVSRWLNGHFWESELPEVKPPHTNGRHKSTPDFVEIAKQWEATNVIDLEGRAR